MDEIEKKRREYLEKAEEMDGKTVEEIDITNYLDDPKNKGNIGQVVQIFLGQNPNSNPHADFSDAQMELKVTGLIPYKKTKNGNVYHAKERLVLSMINYSTDRGVPFEKSHLLAKCDCMLITCYEYIKPKPGNPVDYKSFPIIKSFIYKLTEEDKSIIKSDYDTILQMINDGKAEMLSESSTNYLAACRKGAGKGKDLQEQIGSNVKAPTRAFSFKPSFITALIRKYISNETFEHVVSGLKSPIDYILERAAKYEGKHASELEKIFPKVNPKAKNAYALYVSAMAKLKNLSKTEEFVKANIIVKTVRVEKDGSIEQDMSFGNIDFEDTTVESWKESKWSSYFEGASLFLCIFRNQNPTEDSSGKKKKGDYVFDGIKIYHLPEIVADGFIRFTYDKASETLMNGEIIREIQETKGPKIGIRHMTNFVGKKTNPVSHIRPKGQDFARGQKPLLVPDKLTGFKTYLGQCLWLDKRFIQAIIEDRADEYLEEAKKKMAAKGNFLHALDED